MKTIIAAGIASVAAAFAGCSNSGYGTVGATNTYSGNLNPGGSTPPLAPSTSTALFQPSAGVLPYPNDLYFAGSTDGTLNIQPLNALMPNQMTINGLDGFSVNGVIRTTFGGPINPATLAANVIVLPVTTDNTKNLATTNVLGPPLTPGVDYAIGTATDTGVGPEIMEITPLHPLTPSTCIQNGSFLGAACTTSNGYLVILTNGIKDAFGNAAVPSADYAAIKTALAGGPSCPSITDPTLNGVCRLTGAHLQIAEQALHLNPANIVLTFSFTTVSTADSLELLSATTVPPANAMVLNALPLTTSQAKPALTGHANILVGVLNIPYYLSKSAPLTGFWTAPPFPRDPTSTFVTRFNPVPKATQNLMIPVLATVPNANSTFVKFCTMNPPCPATWPVVIFQHGITANREEVLALADSFADAGFAVVAIDLPLHGITTPYNPADPTTFFYANSANPFYAGLGLPANGSIERTFDLALIAPPAIDSSGIHFINLTSLLTSRDNLRQASADLITLERSLAGATVANAGGAKIFTAFPSQPSHYLGHSLGAVVGTAFLAVVRPTEVSTGTLANGGGNITHLLKDSATFGPLIDEALAAQGAPRGSTLYANFQRDSQNAVDAGDPVNYIVQATELHPIHLFQVVGSTPQPDGCTPQTFINGCADQVLPNSATTALIAASTFGLEPLTQLPTAGTVLPTVKTSLPGSTGLRAYVNFLQGEHQSIALPVVPAVTAEMQAEAISFTGAAMPPAIPLPTPPGSTLAIGLGPLSLKPPVDPTTVIEIP
jgi:pimeloyl-ACP methyl ester carboxylesterase